MNGLGEEKFSGYVLEEFESYLPKKRSDILDAISSILSEKYVQSVIIEIGKPIRYTKYVKESEETSSRDRVTRGPDLDQVVRNIRLDEVSLDDVSLDSDEDFREKSLKLAKIFLVLATKNLFLTHIGTSTSLSFIDWLGGGALTGIHRSMFDGIIKFGGAVLVQHEDIPENVVVFCAGRKMGGELSDVTYALKLSTEKFCE